MSISVTRTGDFVNTVSTGTYFNVDPWPFYFTINTASTSNLNGNWSLYCNDVSYKLMDRLLTMIYMKKKLLQYGRNHYAEYRNRRLQSKRQSKKFKQILKNRQLKHPQTETPTALYPLKLKPEHVFIQKYLELNVIRIIAEFVSDK